MEQQQQHSTMQCMREVFVAGIHKIYAVASKRTIKGNSFNGADEMEIKIVVVASFSV